MKNEAYITLKVKLGVETVSFDTDEYFVTVESAEVVDTDISEHMSWMCANGEFNTTDVDINMVVPSTIEKVLTTPPSEEPMIIETYDKSDIEKLVVGRRIIAVKEGEGGKILLDNGVELQFRYDSECCSWFSTNVVEGELADSVITAVSVSVEEDSYDPEVQYTIHILSQNTVVSSLNVKGDTGTGYYLSGATLTVTKVSVADKVRAGNTFNLPFEIMSEFAEES